MKDCEAGLSRGRSSLVVQLQLRLQFCGELWTWDQPSEMSPIQAWGQVFVPQGILLSNSISSGQTGLTRTATTELSNTGALLSSALLTALGKVMTSGPSCGVWLAGSFFSHTWYMLSGIPTSPNLSLLHFTVCRSSSGIFPSLTVDLHLFQAFKSHLSCGVVSFPGSLSRC